jgi:type II secretory pathway pseudopilin PulG
LSNVLIGIVGVILFIGLALAGASFFGPSVAGSIQESKAMSAMRVVSETAMAVVSRNRDTESVLPAALSADALVPDYLSELPVNPVNGGPVMLLTTGAQTSGGPATVVAIKLSPTPEQIKICEAANLASGGPVPVRTYSQAIPTQRSGCVQSGVNYGAIAASDYVMFQKI